MLKKVKPVTLALLFYAGLCYVAGVIRTYSILRFPYVVEYGESTILYQIRVLFRGIFPYNAHLVEQHNFFSYTPFFQYLVSLSASTPQAWLFNARLLNSLSLFGVGVLISLLYFQWKNEERKPIHFVLPLLLWLSWYPVFNWMALGRLDGLALLMQVLGLYFYLHPTRQNLFKILAMIAFVFAFFTKQSAVWIPASLIIYNLFNKTKEWRWIIYFSGVALGLGGLALFSEGTLWTHLFKSNQNVFSLSLLIENLRANVVFHLGLLVIAVCALPKIKLNAVNMLIVIMAITCLPYIIGIGREGSSVNFLLESCVVLTWLTVMGAERIERTWVGAIIGVLLVFLAQWDSVNFRINFLRPDNQAWSNYSFEAEESTSKVIALLKEKTGEVWSEDISLPLFAGKDVAYFPFEYAQGFSRGSLKEEPFLDKVREKKIELIVLENPTYRSPAKRFSDKMINEIGQNYELISQDRFFFVYAPNTKTQ